MICLTMNIKIRRNLFLEFAMVILGILFLANNLTNYYEYADNIRNLPVKELMRRQGEKRFKRTDPQIREGRVSCFFVHFIFAGETWESLAGNQ